MSATSKDIIELTAFHRSRERIRDFGEVFTPEEYVNSMLSIISKGRRSFWDNEEIVFFEPTCGHGNIVIPIVEKRLISFLKKAIRDGIEKPELYAIANTINGLWAIDIDAENITVCRERIFTEILDFISIYSKERSLRQYIVSNKSFFSHLLCAIEWHIHENEALSAITGDEKAAKQTKSGAAWIKEHDSHILDLNESWVAYYRDCEKQNLIPLQFEQADRFVTNIIKGSARGLSKFAFASELFDLTTNQSLYKKRKNLLEAGA